MCVTSGNYHSSLKLTFQVTHAKCQLSIAARRRLPLLRKHEPVLVRRTIPQDKYDFSKRSCTINRHGDETVIKKCRNAKPARSPEKGGQYFKREARLTPRSACT